MSVAELKKSIIEKLKVVDDEELLTAVNRWLELNQDLADEEVYNLSEGQLRAVNEGIEDYKANRVISDEDLNKEIDEWLGK